jgi:hypothetical protein
MFTSHVIIAAMQSNNDFGLRTYNDSIGTVALVILSRYAYQLHQSSLVIVNLLTRCNFIVTNMVEKNTMMCRFKYAMLSMVNSYDVDNHDHRLFNIFGVRKDLVYYMMNIPICLRRLIGIISNNNSLLRHMFLHTEIQGRAIVITSRDLDSYLMQSPRSQQFSQRSHLSRDSQGNVYEIRDGMAVSILRPSMNPILTSIRFSSSIPTKHISSRYVSPPITPPPITPYNFTPPIDQCESLLTMRFIRNINHREQLNSSMSNEYTFKLAQRYINQDLNNILQMSEEEFQERVNMRNFTLDLRQLPMFQQCEVENVEEDVEENVEEDVEENMEEDVEENMEEDMKK